MSYEPDSKLLITSSADNSIKSLMLDNYKPPANSLIETHESNAKDIKVSSKTTMSIKETSEANLI